MVRMHQMSKIQARAEFLQSRRDLTDADRRHAAEALAKEGMAAVAGMLPAGATVAGYLSVGGEPGTAGLLTALTDAGYRVVVPICEPDRRLSWSYWTPGVEMAPGLFDSLLEPAGARYTATDLPGLGLILVPALAADDAGGRMGKGGGYYDRFLARLRACGNATPAVAVVYDHEFVPAGRFETTPLDAPVDGVLTPSGWHELPAKRMYT